MNVLNDALTVRLFWQLLLLVTTAASNGKGREQQPQNLRASRATRIGFHHENQSLELKERKTLGLPEINWDGTPSIQFPELNAAEPNEIEDIEGVENSTSSNTTTLDSSVTVVDISSNTTTVSSSVTVTIARGTGYPLGLCRGACRGDEDCEGDLYCYARRGFEAVPGCYGGSFESTGMSYCILSEYRPPTIAPSLSPTSAPSSSPTSAPTIVRQETESFQIRLYWRRGYEWQDSSREFLFCATYDFDGGRSGQCAYNNFDTGPCYSDNMYLSRCRGLDNQHFVFIPLDSADDGEIMIKPDDGSNRCWARSDDIVTLEDCNEWNEDQRWFAPNGGFFNDERFELSQRGYSSQCVTTPHHPKAGERLEFDSCSSAQEDLTSYWTKYKPLAEDEEPEVLTEPPKSVLTGGGLLSRFP